jgi:hypothetical protein
MSSTRPADPGLDELITEITVDCHNENEQLQAFENAFDEDAHSPCPGTVGGEDVEVLSTTTNTNRRELIATCHRNGRSHQVALLDINLNADPPPHAYSPHTAAGTAADPTSTPT